MITLLPLPAKPIRMSGRVLKPELLQNAERALAERNLHGIARINRWFGGHRALLSVMNELAPRGKQFSVLDIGAASGDMGNCIRRHFLLAPAKRIINPAIKEVVHNRMMI